MALNRKYSALPDLDTAPDIYETPDLIDDNSTLTHHYTTTLPSHSDEELDDIDDDAAGISRSRLRIDQARSRFLPAQVDARDVDFSDRLDGKRKAYKVSSRRRVLEDGTQQIGGLSDEEDSEDLDRKIARLKREIEEAKEERARQKPATGAPPAQDEDLSSLSKALDDMYTAPVGGTVWTRTMRTTTANGPSESGPPPSVSADTATYTVTYAPDYEQSHALAKAADFDRRLVSLEKAIGITSSSLPELENNGLPRAIMPTLDVLQREILTLSEASTSSLDSITRRVRTLAQEADQLEKSRRAAKAAQDSLESSGVVIAEAGGGPENAEQTARINALYGALPTIENLTPLLPPLLDRLRSLRAIHADAGSATETLERIEKSQSDMAVEIKQWREGLDRIEGAMREGDEAMKVNMKTVDGWVRDLEAKMTELS